MRVQDDIGTVSVCLFNDEVQAILNNVTAYQLVEKYGKVFNIVCMFNFLMKNNEYLKLYNPALFVM